MNQLYELSRKFPDKFIHKKASGFGDYIQHSVIRQRLLTVLGAYSTDIVETLYDDGIITGVVLKLSCVIDGKEISVVEAGDVENPTNWKTNGARMKDAMSDAIKRFVVNYFNESRNTKHSITRKSNSISFCSY